MDQIKIGKFIAACRKEQKLTQSRLAEHLGVSDRAVSKWETGRCLPDVSIMQELCEILGISVGELLAGERLVKEYQEERSEETMLTLLSGKEKAEKTFLELLVGEERKKTLAELRITAALVIFLTVAILAGMVLSYLFPAPEAQVVILTFYLVISFFIVAVWAVTTWVLRKKD